METNSGMNGFSLPGLTGPDSIDLRGYLAKSAENAENAKEGSSW